MYDNEKGSVLLIAICLIFVLTIILIKTTHSSQNLQKYIFKLNQSHSKNLNDE
jgi:hypothetical protein